MIDTVNNSVKLNSYQVTLDENRIKIHLGYRNEHQKEVSGRGTREAGRMRLIIHLGKRVGEGTKRIDTRRQDGNSGKRQFTYEGEWKIKVGEESSGASKG